MKKSKILMFIGVLLLFALYVFPLWNITLEAPQYPTPLGMNIHINKIADDHPYDVKNINLMNHYVGMKEIPLTLPELQIFPIVIGIMIALGLFIALAANYKWYLGWFVVMTLLGIGGMYDFYLWEFDYGHTLSPKAIIKFTNEDGTMMAYQPPLFGTKTILNFTAHSYPRTGAYFLFVGMFCSLFAYFLGKKESVSDSDSNKDNTPPNLLIHNKKNILGPI
jgi:copper chaperone NosL